VTGVRALDIRAPASLAILLLVAVLTCSEGNRANDNQGAPGSSVPIEEPIDFAPEDRYDDDEAAREAGYEEGYDAGCEHGHDEGYEVGFQDGCQALGDDLVSQGLLDWYQCPCRQQTKEVGRCSGRQWPAVIIPHSVTPFGSLCYHC